MCEYDANNRVSYISSLCCRDAADLIVRCGEWDTQQKEELPFQEIQVDKIQVEKLLHTFFAVARTKIFSPHSL